MKKDTLLGIAWVTGLLAWPVDQWNANLGDLFVVVFLVSLGAGLATPRNR
jgi:hypothetical protein